MSAESSGTRKARDGRQGADGKGIPARFALTLAVDAFNGRGTLRLCLIWMLRVDFVWERDIDAWVRDGFYCSNDASISRAPTKVSGQAFDDLGVTRIRFVKQQSGASHHKAGRAVAALRSAKFGHRFLQQVRCFRVAQPFDGGNTAALYLGSRQEAGIDRDAVQPHGTGAAFPLAAARLCAGQPQAVAENIDQQLVGHYLQ